MSDTANREFGGVYEEAEPRHNPGLSEENRSQHLQQLRDGIIGSNELFTTPYGDSKPIVYADWTASARGIQQIEDYLQKEVMPFYGNTHTSTSITGHQSSCFRHEARQIVADAVNAKVTGRAATDVVIFSGNGTTSSIDKLIQGMGLNLPIPVGYDENIYTPVVFVSAYEHHSNLLPWRESRAEVVTVKYSSETGIDLMDLSSKLALYKNRAVKIGAFCAASNVTGITTAVDEVCILLHEANALAFFDYATAAPYVKMDMNPVQCKFSKPAYLNTDEVRTLSTSSWDPKYAYKDAMYFSGHKFLGGVGSPGVLVVKRTVLPVVDTLPSTPGGGTVFFVTHDHHRYLSNREEREEGGTPNIMGDIKIGLAMSLKQSIGDTWIEEEEFSINMAITQRLDKHKNIVLLGKNSPDRSLPIFSFLVRHGDRFLHYNFVCALLNDLFGVQIRGGCQCAGPFAHSLLGLNGKTSAEIEAALLEKHEVLRPGFARFSVPFWVTEVEMNYVLSAIEFVASHGFRFLPSYRYNHKTGEWAHSTRLTKFPERKWLGRFDVLQNTSSSATTNKVDLASISKDIFDAANKELASLHQSRVKAPATDTLGTWERLRWFVLGSEVLAKSEGSLLGPIQPSNTMSIVHSTDDGVAQTETMSSAYISKQDKKFSVNTGGGRTLPQYMISFGAKSGVSPQETRSTLSESVQAPLSTPTMLLLVEPVQNGPDKETATAAGVDVDVDATKGSQVDCQDGLCLLPVKRNVPDIPEGHKVKAIQPPKKLMRVVGQCMQDWSMIKDGDRIMLGLSGGKDSLSLLHVLLAIQKKAPVKFDLACCTIDPQTASFDPSPLIPYVRGLGVEYFYISKPIIEMASTKMQGDSLCAFCSRFKRGLLYSTCRENKYNKLVLAQHLDDMGESFLMSALHNGQLRTMKAKYTIDAGDLEVIRPFSYMRESLARDFAREASLPVISENCPACFEEPKERARVKQLLYQEESMVPALFSNLRKALLPLMHDDTYATMESVVAQIEGNSNRGGGGKKRGDTERQLPQSKKMKSGV
jgi:selenocysteine lyase/cysteine desulfurase/tRNA(Ile)-lysidine synthase TilS/MesJ